MRWLILQIASVTVGLGELERHLDDSIEILTFGLAPEHRGVGFGVPALSLVGKAAWAHLDSRGRTTTSVWAQTNPDDHAALTPTFLKCGFHPAGEPGSANASGTP